MQNYGGFPPNRIITNVCKFLRIIQILAELDVLNEDGIVDIHGLQRIVSMKSA